MNASPPLGAKAGMAEPDYKDIFVVVVGLSLYLTFFHSKPIVAMSSSKMSFLFPNPVTTTWGAWYLAIGLIGQANFNEPQSQCEVIIDDLFLGGERLSYSWLVEAASIAREFSIVAYDSSDFEEAYFDSMSLFDRTSYRDNPRRMIARFNSLVLRHLQQLQTAIRELSRRHELTPANLAARLEASTPLLVFDMGKAQAYTGLPMISLLEHNGRIKGVL
jgi:hypothetical protein